MSVIAEDLATFTSMLKMVYNFLNGNSSLKRKKYREKKKIISVALPYSDLIYACGAIPVFPIRMEKFEVNKYVVALGSASSVLGWDNVTNILGFLKKLNIKSINTTFDKVIEEVVETVNKKYNQLYDLGIESGISTDFCYGIKSLYGMHVSKGKNVDANLNFTIRCSAWNKYIESLKTVKYNTKQIIVDMPPRDIGNAIELLTDNLSKAVNEIEKITGINCSDNILREQFKIRNQICQQYKTIIYEISASDFYPCNPAAFAQIVSLISSSFQDYSSDAKRYLENMTSLVNEMKNRIRKGIGMDCSNMPRILVTPMFAGGEPKSHEYIYEFGGRTLYADWDILGFLDEVQISRNSDPLEDYARFVMKTNSKYMGCDNETMTDSYLNVAKEINADGLVFNQLFGCHSISNCYRMLRDKLRREDIPSTALTFNKIGENLGQVKTRIQAFMEMFQ